jgi:hypothetical protein
MQLLGFLSLCPTQQVCRKRIFPSKNIRFCTGNVASGPNYGPSLSALQGSAPPLRLLARASRFGMRARPNFARRLSLARCAKVKHELEVTANTHRDQHPFRFVFDGSSRPALLSFARREVRRIITAFKDLERRVCKRHDQVGSRHALVARFSLGV